MTSKPTTLFGELEMTDSCNEPTELAHNDIRFDIALAHIYPMIESGEVKMPDLIQKLRKAITDVIDNETDWRQYPGDGHVRSTGGDGSGATPKPLHDEVIVYDFS